jgi:hypothetical protein
VVAAIDAAVAAGAAELGGRVGVRDATLLPAMFCAAAVIVASDESAWAGAVSGGAEPGAGARSAARGSPGLKLSGAELPTFESLDVTPAGCLAFAGSVTGAGLMSRTGDCSLGIGVGVGAVDVVEMERPTVESPALATAGCLTFAGSVTGAGLMSRTGVCSVGIGAGVWAEDVVEKVLGAELVGTTRLRLWAGEDTGWSFGWTGEFPRSDDGAGCASSSAGVSGTAENSAAGTDGDWIIGDWTIRDWSSAKVVAPVGIGAWDRLSAAGGAVEGAVVAGETVAGETVVRETGVSEAGVSGARTVGVGRTESEEFENCACAVESRVGALGNSGAASEGA